MVGYQLDDDSTSFHGKWLEITISIPCKKSGWIWSSGGIVLGLVNFLLLQGNPQFFGDETRVPEGGTELANINHGLKR